MFTKQYPRHEVQRVIQENLKFPRQYAAELLFNHATIDWRKGDPADQHPDAGRRWQGQSRSPEIAGLDRGSDQGRSA